VSIGLAIVEKCQQVKLFVLGRESVEAKQRMRKVFFVTDTVKDRHIPLPDLNGRHHLTSCSLQNINIMMIWRPPNAFRRGYISDHGGSNEGEPARRTGSIVRSRSVDISKEVEERDLYSSLVVRRAGMVVTMAESHQLLEVCPDMRVCQPRMEQTQELYQKT
jgi:hypothetical protein